MRTESFNGALLSTLIIASLMVPAITLLSVSPVSAQHNPENIIVQGDVNAYTKNKTGVPPWKLYKAGDFPPIMAAKRIGSGAVVAAGFARTTNGGVGYATQRWEDGELDVLFDVAFRWMTGKAPSEVKVLWYGEYIDALEGTYEYAYNNAETGSWLIDELMAKGYKVDNTIDDAFTEITSDLLTDIDILVTPQLEVGDPLKGGDPAGLPDDVVQVIKSFVEGGKGLFIMEMADIDTYNFYRVQNKILEALNFGIYFQPDTIRDPNSADDRYVTATVTDNEFGVAYQEATGKATIRVYKPCSLAPGLENYAVSVEILPEYREGLKGGTLEYEVKVTNVGKITDDYNLTAVSDNLEWGLTISPSVLELENNFEPKYATLSVTIPSDAAIGTANKVTVTATSEDNALVSENYLSIAIVANRVRPSTADAQVVEAKPDENSGGRMFMYVGSSATGEHMNERIFVKFDLKALGTQSVANVRLYLYCFAINGMPDQTVRLYRVDENWWEDNINWDNQPQIAVFTGENATDENETVVDTDRWYSWDVTSYVQGQRENDNLASFALSYGEGKENATYPDNWSYGFDTKEFYENFAHPYLAVWYSVRTTVTYKEEEGLPGYKEGLPGGELKYTVMVQNTGALHDTYSLTVSDNAIPSWGPKFLATGENIRSLTLAPGAFDFATVTVTIPLVDPGENIDNLLVIATSTDPTVSDNCWFVANVSDTNIRPPEDDSTVKQAEPFRNWVWGTYDDTYQGYVVSVGRESGGPERSFLKFDLSAIPPDTDIARARLWLNAERVKDVGAVVRVHSVSNDSWIERGAGRLMWDNQPSIGENLDVRAVVEEDKQYFWDVTEFVENEFAGDKMASFALVDLGENLPPDIHTARFTSKESDPNLESKIRENHPYLEILSTEPTHEVRAYISPIFQGGLPGATLEYIVTVKNTGTVEDNYPLTVSDSENWGPTLDNYLFKDVQPGENRTTTLRVYVASDIVGTLDRITVTATGTDVSDDAMCFAHVGKAEFKLENLYKISIDPILRLREDADNLVAEFYTYADSYQTESVVWENMPKPWHLTSENKKPVPHPQDKAVEKVRLVLVDETSEETTVASFTVNRDDLFGRIRAIKGRWPYAGPDERDALMAEIRGIKGKWPYAP